MKKIFLILSIIAVFLLTGCNSYKDVNNNLPENDAKQQITENNDDKQQITKNDTTSFSSQEAKMALFYALRDNAWVAENVSIKPSYFEEESALVQTCFGEESTLKQELNFEILRDDLVIVEASFLRHYYNSETEKFYDSSLGTHQIFLVGYKDGEIEVISLSGELPDTGAAVHAVDKENLVLKVIYGGYGSWYDEVAYKIDNLSFKELEGVYSAIDDNDAFEAFNKKYFGTTTLIKTELTYANLLKEFLNIDASDPLFESENHDIYYNQNYNEYAIYSLGHLGPYCYIVIQAPDGSLVYRQPTTDANITIENNKLYISSKDELADHDELISAGFTLIDEESNYYYRVYYELVEKDGKFEANKIRVDKQDVTHSAET